MIYIKHVKPLALDNSGMVGGETIDNVVFFYCLFVCLFCFGFPVVIEANC